MFECSCSRNDDAARRRAAPKHSFITLKRILIIQTICVVHGASTRLHFICGWVMRWSSSADKRNEKSKKKMKKTYSSSLVRRTAEQQLLFDAFALFELLSRCTFRPRHIFPRSTIAALLMKCVYKTISCELKMDKMHTSFLFLHSRLDRRCVVCVCVCAHARALELR